MNHQNWNYTVLTTKKGMENQSSERLVTKAIVEGKEVDTVKKITGPNKTSNPQNIKKILESDEIKVETISHDFKIALQQARQAKKLTQAQLAQLINEKQSIVADYESGRAIPNPQVISKLERALGARLPREKKKKENKKNSEEF